MKFISKNKITEELVNSFYGEITLELPKKPEEDNYMNLFKGLKNCQLLRAFVINKSELT